jgi:alkylhydroperoxidase family enzyme
MRMKPLNPPYTPEAQAVLDRLPTDWAPPFVHYRILARDPRLLASYLQSVAYLNPSHITARQREVFLLRVTGRCRNAFEWCLRVHYFASTSGMTDEQIHASVHGNADDPVWEPTDRLLIRLADELHETVSISDALWAELHPDFTEEALLQLMLMAGHYRTNAYLARALDLPIEPRAGRAFPAA